MKFVILLLLLLLLCSGQIIFEIEGVSIEGCSTSTCINAECTEDLCSDGCSVCMGNDTCTKCLPGFQTPLSDCYDCTFAGFYPNCIDSPSSSSIFSVSSTSVFSNSIVTSGNVIIEISGVSVSGCSSTSCISTACSDCGVGCQLCWGTECSQCLPGFTSLATNCDACIDSTLTFPLCSPTTPTSQSQPQQDSSSSSQLESLIFLSVMSVALSFI